MNSEPSILEAAPPAADVEAPRPVLGVDESYRRCRELARNAGSTFYYSFFTLPNPLFEQMCVLYAFMRHTDDLGDSPGRSTEQRYADLTAWRDEIQNLSLQLSGSHDCLPAMADVIAKTGLPISYLDDVIVGVLQDLLPVQMATEQQLRQYCYHVAGAVGLACTHLWGSTNPAAREIAIDCGFAFQLTNIIRDIAEDAAAGRRYLPDDHLARFSVSASDLAAGIMTPAIRNLLEFEANLADAAYARCAELRHFLQPSARAVFDAMRSTYHALLCEIRRRDYDVFHGRVRLSKWLRLWLVARAMCRY